MKTLVILLLRLALASCASSSAVADALTPVPVPAEFQIRSTRINVPVVYAKSAGETDNVIDKRVIEALCKDLRELGLSNKPPVFEAGYDKPVKTESLRFSNATHWAHLTTLHAYVCIRPEGMRSGDDAVCGCTYAVRPQYRLHIKNTLPDGVETLLVDVTRRTVERRVAPRPRPDLKRDAERVRALAPEAVGRDVIAGIPCVVRRQSLGGQSHIDRCIAEDPDQHLPPELRNQALSETIPSLDGKSIFRWTRTEKVVLDATVNSGVFMIPEGFTVKGTP